MIVRRVGAIAAVSALVLLSVATGSTAAIAAPVPPSITYPPVGWVTSSDTIETYGSDPGSTAIRFDVTISNSLVTNAPYCPNLPIDGSSTNLWHCDAPVTTLALGDNTLSVTSSENADGSDPSPASTIVVTRVTAPTITSPADGIYTNDYMPLFSGTAEGSYFSVDTTDESYHFCDGTVVNLTWNCEVASPGLPDGDYEYIVESGSVYSSPRTIHIDTVLNPLLSHITGPVDTVDGAGALHAATTDPTPTITGTAEPFATITLWQDYIEVGCAGGAPIADAAGNWSCTLAAPLTTARIYVFGSQHTDRAGNTNVGSSPDEQLYLDYTDTTPPAAPVILSPIQNEFALAYTAATNNTSPTITGTGEPGAHLSLFIDGSPDACTAPVTVDPAGDWACLVPGMTEGEYHINFSLIDAYGNVSAQSPKDLILTIDTTPPDAFELWTPTGTFSAGVTTATTSSAHPFLSGFGEYGASMQIYVDGSTPVVCQEGPAMTGEGGFGCTVSTALAPGIHDFGFSQTDAVGNSSGPPVVHLRLTVLAPPPPAPSPTPTPTPTINPLPRLLWLLSFTTDSDNPTPGQNVTLTGSGLPIGAKVFAELQSTPTPLGTTTVLDDGTFRLNTVIPNTVEPGEHHYVVTVTPADGEPQTTSMPVTVMPAPPVVIPEPAPTPPALLPLSSPGAAGAAGDTAPTANRDRPDAPNTLGATLPTLHDVVSNPLVLGSAAASSLALLFLVAIPAELLNSTLDENYARLFGRLPKPKVPWMQRTRERVRSKPLLGGAILTALAAFVMSFSDPGFGLDLASLRLFLACLVGMFVLGFVANAITGAIIGRRWNIGSVIELQPIGIAIALVGVVLSRVLDFAPGLLVGLVLTLSLSASATARDEARYVLTWFGVVLGISVLCWLGFSLLGGLVAPGTFGGALVDDSLAAVATEGVSALLIGLLPLGYFDGRVLFRYSKLQWLVTYLVTLVAFFVIVVPSGALWGDIRGPFWLWLTVFVVFAAVCVGAYLLSRALERRREAREAAEAVPEPAVR